MIDRTRLFINIFYRPLEEQLEYYRNLKHIGSVRFFTQPDGISEILGQKPLIDANPQVNRLVNEWSILKTVYDDSSLSDGCDYIGYNHYRRTFREIPEDSDADIFVMKPIRLLFRISGQKDKYAQANIEGAWRICHIPEVWDVLENSLKSQKWVDSALWDEWKSQMHLNAPCCMFLMRRELFKEMFEFCWPVVRSFSENMDLSEFDGYQKRQSAFIGERMLSYWVFKKTRDGSVKVTDLEIDFNQTWKPSDAPDRGSAISAQNKLQKSI